MLVDLVRNGDPFPEGLFIIDYFMSVKYFPPFQLLNVVAFTSIKAVAMK